MPFLGHRQSRKHRTSSPVSPSTMEVLSSPVSQVSVPLSVAQAPIMKEAQKRANHSSPSVQPRRHGADDNEVRLFHHQDKGSQIVDTDLNDQCHEQLLSTSAGKVDVTVKKNDTAKVKEQASTHSRNGDSRVCGSRSKACSVRPEEDSAFENDLSSPNSIVQAKGNMYTYLLKTRQYVQLFLSSFLVFIVSRTKRFYNTAKDIITEAWKVAKEDFMEYIHSNPVISRLLGEEETKPKTDAHTSFTVTSEGTEPASSWIRSISNIWNRCELSSSRDNSGEDRDNFRRQNLTLSSDSAWCPQDSGERTWVLSEGRADENSVEDKIEKAFPVDNDSFSSEALRRPKRERKKTGDTIRLSCVKPMEVGEVERMSSVVGNYVREIEDSRKTGDTPQKKEVKTSSAFKDDEIKPIVPSANPVSTEPKVKKSAQEDVTAESSKTDACVSPTEQRTSTAFTSVQAIRAKVVRTGAGVRNAARSLARPLQRYNRGQSETQFFHQETAGTTTTLLARLLTHSYGCEVEATRRRKHMWKIRCTRPYTNGSALRVKFVVQPVDAHSCIVFIYPARNSSGIREGSAEYSAFVASLQEVFFAGTKAGGE